MARASFWMRWHRPSLPCCALCLASSVDLMQHHASSSAAAAAKLDLPKLRCEFASRLAPLAVPPAQQELVTCAFAHFAGVMDEYQFPKYNLDVDSFANDLVQACLCSRRGSESGLFRGVAEKAKE